MNWGRGPKTPTPKLDSVVAKAKKRAGSVDRGTRMALADNVLSDISRALFELERHPGEEDLALEVHHQARVLLGICEAVKEFEHARM